MSDFLESLPGYNLRRASTTVLGDLVEALNEIDLRPADVSMLLKIRDKPKVTPSELGKQLGIKRANMVAMVARLEERKAVSRHPIDGRSFGLELTKAGSDLCDEAIAILTEQEATVLERVPPEHRPHLVPALRALWKDRPQTF